MNSKAVRRTVLAAGALVCFSYPQFASAATSAIPCETSAAPSNVTSCATGLYANLSVLGGVVGATIGPVDNAFGTAPAAYNTGNLTVASANVSAALGVLGGLTVTTGVITDKASSPYTGTLATLSSTASSTVNNLNLFLGVPAVVVAGNTITPAISALGISATTLGSTSLASKTTGTIVTSGSSFITGLVISVLGTPISLNASVLAAAPVNYDILSADALNIAGLSIFANYQTPILLGTDRIGTQTSALAVILNGFGFDGGVLNGTILIADSAAAVPEPATWAMMIFGFGLVGALTRRRRTATVSFAGPGWHR